MSRDPSAAPPGDITVERLGPDDWDAVRPLLCGHDPELPADRWRTLFHRPWEDEDDHRGFGMVSDGRVVGFCGVVRSRREIDGRTARLANLTAWVVEPSFRSHSLRVISPLLRGRDETLTDLTPSPEVVRWMARWGFTPVPTEAVVTVPAPLPVPSRRGPWVATDPDAVLDALDGEVRRVVADHLAAPVCGAVVAGRGEDRCALVYTAVTGGSRPHALVLYASDPAFLRRHHLLLRNAVARAAGVRFVVFDRRLLPGRLPLLAWRMPLSTPWLVRPAGVDPRRVDALYSEVALLGIPAAAGLRPSAGELRGRLTARLRRADGSRDGTDTTTRSGE